MMYIKLESLSIVLYVGCSKRVLSFLWFTISACSVTGKTKKKGEKNYKSIPVEENIGENMTFSNKKKVGDELKTPFSKLFL